MKQTTIFKKYKKKGYVENILTPMTLSGVVVPWKKKLGSNQESSYKLVCSNGAEYFILTDSEFNGVLSWYCWDEVRVVGLLNLANMTLIPQKVFPKGPRGEMENVIDLVTWKGRNFIKRMTKNMNDLVLVPAALLAVMSAAKKREEDPMNIETNQFNQGKETFYEIFQRTLNNKSSSRPPKIELTGLLFPNKKNLLGIHCQYILETDSREYFLNMNEAIIRIAKKLECEEVTVKGYLDLETNILEVEKLSLASEPHRLLTSFSDAYFDLNEFKRIIAQCGKLEPSNDYVAS